MATLLAAIADDYTGASDLANTWRRNGLSTIQTIGVPRSLDTGGAEAIVVSLKIRSVPAGEAVAAATRAYEWLKAIGVGHVMYKICSTFDSTDQGNVGPVTDALRGMAGSGWSLVTPAFPGTRRTVFKGHLFVEDVLLSESPLKDHPLNPMRDADLVRVLSRQSSDRVGLLDLVTVHGGVEACRARIERLAADGVTSIIADAIFEGDLETLGRIAIGSPVSTGASGLGLGLARSVARDAAGSAPETGADDLVGHAAILAGSCSTRTLQQIAEAEKIMPVLRLDADALVASGGDVTESLTWATARLADGPVLIAAGADPAEVRRVQAAHGAQRASHTIEAAIGTLAAALVDGGVRRLVVAGGETSGAVVDRLGIAGFRVGEEIAPGVPALRTIGRPGGDLAMILKSGNFGGPDFFEHALARLQDRAEG